MNITLKTIVAALILALATPAFADPIPTATPPAATDNADAATHTTASSNPATVEADSRINESAQTRAKSDKANEKLAAVVTDLANKEKAGEPFTADDVKAFKTAIKNAKKAADEDAKSEE
jgi:hypothetical protein